MQADFFGLAWNIKYGYSDPILTHLHLDLSAIFLDHKLSLFYGYPNPHKAIIHSRQVA